MLVLEVILLLHKEVLIPNVVLDLLPKIAWVSLEVTINLLLEVVL